MAIRYEILKSRRLEYIIFLGIVRVFLEFFDISLRRGRFFFIPAISAHTVFFAVSVILLCAGALSRREGMGAFGVAGMSYVYFYFIVVDILTMISQKSAYLVFYVISCAFVFISGVMVLSYMFGKISNKTAKIGCIASSGVAVAYSVYAIVQGFASDVLLFSDMLDVLSPLMLLFICLDSRESRY